MKASLVFALALCANFAHATVDCTLGAQSEKDHNTYDKILYKGEISARNPVALKADGSVVSGADVQGELLDLVAPSTGGEGAIIKNFDKRMAGATLFVGESSDDKSFMIAIGHIDLTKGDALLVTDLLAGGSLEKPLFLIDDVRHLALSCHEVAAAAPAEPAQPAPTQQAQPAPTEQAQPAPSQQAQPAPTEQAQPAPSQQAQPAPSQQAQPAPTEQAQPAPSQQAQPAPSQQAQPAPTEQAQPAPTQQAQPAPTEQAQPAPSQQAQPAPTEQAQPAPSQQAQPAPSEQAQPAPTEQAEPAPTKKEPAAPATVPQGQTAYAKPVR